MDRFEARACGSRWGTPALLAALVLSGLVALWMRFNAAPPALGDVVASDLIDYFYPLNRLAALRLSAGELPLWNPHACSGIPLLATLQVGALYPGTWLTLWLPESLALPALVFVQCFLGGWFAALLFRRWRVDAWTAATGGILFVFACQLGQSFWPNQVAAIAWMPWLLLCGDALAERFRWRWWAGLAIGTALQLLAGFPQYVIFTFYLLLPYAALRALEPRSGPEHGDAPRGRGRSVARVILAIGTAAAVGAGIAAAQLLPTFELVGHGMRSAPLGPEQVHYLRGMAGRSTWIFENLIDPQPKLPSFDFQTGAGYFGIATLIALVAGAAGGQRLAWLLLGGGAVSFALSFGYRGPTAAFYHLYSELPGSGLFRTPERFRLLAFFSLIALAVLGFDRIRRGLADASGQLSRPALLGMAGAATAIGVLGPVGAAWRAALACALVVAIVVARERPSLRRAAQASLLLFVVADVVHATGTDGSLRAFPLAWTRVLHSGGDILLDERGLARIRARTGRARVEVVDADPLLASPPLHDAYRVSCYEPLVPEPWPSLFAELGGDTTWGQLLFGIDPEERPTFYDVTSVGTIVVPMRERSRARAKMWRRWRRNPPHLPTPATRLRVDEVRNEDALPRAYLAGAYRVVPTERALSHVAAGDVDFHRLVLLDRAPGFASRDDQEAAVRPARIVAYEPERVEIETDAERESLLVLTDTEYPGWRARVDGDEVEILRANGLYRAVRVAAGRHRVVFEYRPDSLRRGVGLSLLSWGVLVGAPATAAIRRRRRG